MRLLLALALALAAPHAGAQYPAKPVRLVVGFPAGGAADAVARIMAQAISPGLGQPVIVENKPGAESAIAAEAVARAAPDGYTILYATASNMAAVPALRRELPYDPIASFAPIGIVGFGTIMLFTHPSLPANSVEELIAYARANPGKVDYGTGNPVSVVGHAQFLRAAGISMVQVPYKGEAPLLPDLVAGRVQACFYATVAQALPFVKEGRLRALAVMLDRRSPLAPEVPTVAEAGIGAVSVRLWAGFAGPARLPAELVQRLSREINAALARPEIHEQLVRQGYDPHPMSPEEFGAYLKSQLAVFRQTVRENNIAVE